MDWQVLIGAVGGAGAVTIAVGLLLRRSLERLLDLKLKEIEERHKVQLVELTRRQAAIFDQQLTPIRTLLSDLYRLRNAAHSFSKADKSEALAHRNEVVRLAAGISHLIIEHKAILPPDIWRVGHTAKGSTTMLFGSKLIDGADVGLDSPDTDAKEFKIYLEEIEELYQRLSRVTLEYLKVQ